MSAAGDSAHVRIILADYASSDFVGKINMIGANITVTGFNNQLVATEAFAVMAVVLFKPEHAGDSPAIELQLEHEADGTLFPMPGILGTHGEPQYLRVGETNPLKHADYEGVHVPLDKIRIRKQIVLNFQNGLPLAPGTLYLWRVKIDGEAKDEWTEQMYVPMSQSAFVLG